MTTYDDLFDYASRPKHPTGVPGVKWTDSLAVARREVEGRLLEGVKCPCCGQLAKTYRRSLRHVHGFFLAVLARAPREPIKYRNHSLCRFARNVNDLPNLQYFNLTESHGRGFWSITETGLRFLRHRITVPAYAHVYDGKVYGYSNDMVTMTDIMRKGDFDYSDIVRMDHLSSDELEELLDKIKDRREAG